MGGLRLALVGAFAFPAPQGSQVFARDQAAALARAGAETSIVCYGHGEGPVPAELEVVRVPPSLSPRSYRSGLHALKPVADAALVAAIRRHAHARGIDVLLAHNAEAALAAIASRSAPVLYVAHTLVEEELSAYVPSAAAGLADRLGRALDRAVAARVDATLALCGYAAQRLGRDARGPVEVVPPGIACGPPPEAEEIARVCVRQGLEPGGFVLYAGNLDAYQELDALRGVARRLPERAVVVATHDRSDAARLAPLRVARVAPEEIRTLTHGAAVAVATRRRRGGFPIKLLNYMEAGRAIVARRGQAQSLRDGCNARLLAEDAGAADFAEAIGELLQDPARASALGRAARATALREHDWDAIAQRTLSLAERVVSVARGRRG